MASTLVKPRVFIVDDEEAVCWALQRSLLQEGYDVQVASSAEEALEQAAKLPPDVILLDVRLPGMNGIEAMERFLSIAPEASIIVMTAFSRLSTAVDAVQQGAFDYFSKPFDLDVALSTVAKALKQREQRPTRSAESLPEADEPHEEFVGRSAPMQEVFKRIALAANSDVSVVIHGETGVGKELVARAIHRFSGRHDKPFLPIHIVALNPNVIESELFGHVRGAYTGAAQDRQGLFSMANGGTVFLDELGEIPLYLQVKLLRLLDQQELTPVGGNRPERIDVRIVAATHQDLQRKVAEGSFRQDLYFRLQVLDISVPPLRERAGDIPLLADHFLRRLGKHTSLPPITVTYLESLSWPGNVRELRNAVERAQLVARSGPLLPEHFPPPAAMPQTASEGTRGKLEAAVREWLKDELEQGEPVELMNRFLEVVEPILLGDVLDRAKGNRLAAAKWLGIHRATFRKRLGAHKQREDEELTGEEES